MSSIKSLVKISWPLSNLSIINHNILAPLTPSWKFFAQISIDCLLHLSQVGLNKNILKAGVPQQPRLTQDLLLAVGAWERHPQKSRPVSTWLTQPFYICRSPRCRQALDSMIRIIFWTESESWRVLSNTVPLLSGRPRIIMLVNLERRPSTSDIVNLDDVSHAESVFFSRHQFQT